MRARRDDLGRLDRNFPEATRSPQNARLVRTGDARQPQSDRTFDDLRLRRVEIRNSFRDGAPNLTVDIPALMSLADKNKLAICGKDFKTGQTLMKTIIAPGLKSRMLGLH